MTSFKPNLNLGQLITILESSERAYAANLREASRLEEKHGSILAAHHRLQAAVLQFEPNPTIHPGIDRIEVLCDEWGSGLKAETVRKLRGNVCKTAGLNLNEANAMPLDAVADALNQRLTTVRIPVKLNWTAIDAEDFERLMFTLITTTSGYEHAEWLQHTNATDRGRDLSVYRVTNDLLFGPLRARVVIQCKHWQRNSVGLAEIGQLRDQMDLWHSPRVDSLVVASTGQFTTDAVDWVEKHNQKDKSLKISMWSASHLEHLLASRSDLISQFNLKN
jgi:hypothetical protein